jgi:hypothetical protein
MVVTSFIKMLAGILFGLISIAITAMSLEAFGDRSFVIPALLRRPNETVDDFPLHLIAQFENSPRKTLA